MKKLFLSLSLLLAVVAASRVPPLASLRDGVQMAEVPALEEDYDLYNLEEDGVDSSSFTDPGTSDGGDPTTDPGTSDGGDPTTGVETDPTDDPDSTSNSGSTDDTTDAPTTTTTVGPTQKPPMSPGAIAGTVIGCLAGVALIIGGVYYMKIKGMLCFED